MSRASRASVVPEPRRLPTSRPGQEGGKRDENRRERTNALANAALALFLEAGVEAVTIDQIVEKAKVAKGSFYRYFEDKTDLVEAIFEPLATDMRAAFARCADALSVAQPGPALVLPYRALAEECGRMFMESPDVIRLYLMESRGPKAGARAPIVKLAEDLLDRSTHLAAVAAGHGLVRPFGARLSAIAVVGAVELLLGRMLVGDDVGSPLEVPEKMVALVLDGVRVPKNVASLGQKPGKKRL